MTTLSQFYLTDLFCANEVNLDSFTENYIPSFYMQYITEWPTLFVKCSDSTNVLIGYLMSKIEGRDTSWHSHITALSVSLDFRKLGLARMLLNDLERVSNIEKAYYVDLFVKTANKNAMGMYEKLGFSVYRRVLGYYSESDNDTSDCKSDRDAFDMRKPLLKDKFKKSIRENGESYSIRPESLYY